MGDTAETGKTRVAGDILIHPQLGTLPARRVLDCVFALHPDGPILHHHVSEMRIEPRGEQTCFALDSLVPDPAHARCRIIPPKVTEFRR